MNRVSTKPGAVQGAVGSQVCLNLARAGWGKWTYVDEDCLLPHNLARHALPGYFVGMPKAPALAMMVGSIVPGEPSPNSIVANVLRPGTLEEELRESLAAADLILDMSASVPAARALARDFDATARRVSIFLNPSGTDLVVIAEDAARKMRLDSLEMQYYRALLQLDDLSDHLVSSEQGIRYGRGCRDVSVVLSQELVALHASIGARVLRKAANQPEASVSVFRVDPDNATVARVDVDLATTVEQEVGEWHLITHEALLERAASYRRDRLPNETGGILLGTVDPKRKVVYAADVLPSPADSDERPTSYIRGTRGLAEQVAHAREITHEAIDYIGEWHSHPAGAGASASTDDLKAISHLTELRAADGYPAVFLIVGDDDHAWHVQG